MITVSDAELLEREEELDTLRALLAGARDGRGGIALVEGPPGQGKTSLLRALRAHAAAAGMRVLAAVGAELERDFAYGIVRQLFVPLDDGLLAASSLNGLVALAADHAAQQPLAIVVDDLHWADAGSLEALGMLARRVEDLPIALVLGVRSLAHTELAPNDDPFGRPAAGVVPRIEALFAVPGAIVVQPEPLSRDAVAQLVEAALECAVEPEFAAAAAETTGGNPLLVRELRRTLAAEAFTGAASEAAAVRRAVPGSIARLVQGRLWRLPPACLGLARAVAALGERSTLVCANALAGLDDAVAARAHATLAAAGLLEPGALRFTHPIMREATLAGLVPATRSCFHRRAALLLHEAGASEEEIAAQVLAAEPGNDERAAQLLTRTGRRALALGDRDVAMHHLRRALMESPDPSPELLIALGLERDHELAA